MDTVSRYFKDIRKSQPLSPDEEKKLAFRIQDGDEEAINLLVEANLKFVVTVARTYQGRGLDLEDLIAEGNVGLIEAAKHFDPNYGFRFISYGCWWIRQAIQAALAQDRLIRLPMNKVGIVNQIAKTTSEFQDKEGRKPSDRELAKAVGISITEVRMMQAAVKYAIQLDQPVGEDGEDTLDSIIEDPKSPKCDSVLVSESLVKDVDMVLKIVLSDREATIVRSSFGINAPVLTDEEIGKKFDISAERVRQLKAAALMKMRKNKKVLNLLREYI